MSSPGPPVTAADVCRNFRLSEPAQQLLRADLLPRPFLDLLIAHEHCQDAVRFMAHSLPKREAVWWACLCSRQGYGTTMPAPAEAALQAVETWVGHPSDENRRAAFAAAQAADLATPAGCTGLAAFLSSGSMAPPTAPAVPAGEHQSRNAAGNAVILAAAQAGARQMAQTYRAFFALGFDVANGKRRWVTRP